MYAQRNHFVGGVMLYLKYILDHAISAANKAICRFKSPFTVSVYACLCLGCRLSLPGEGRSGG